MARKADVKGGNGDVVFDTETGTARKYLRNSWKTIRFYYSEDGTILSDHNGVVKLMCVESLYNILNSIIMEYIS